jgi:hypothetical protein
MAHHESSGATVAAADVILPEGSETEQGFDFWLFGLLLGVAVLVSIQNLWLRRKARRERAER